MFILQCERWPTSGLKRCLLSQGLGMDCGHVGVGVSLQGLSHTPDTHGHSPRKGTGVERGWGAAKRSRLMTEVGGRQVGKFWRPQGKWVHSWVSITTSWSSGDDDQTLCSWAGNESNTILGQRRTQALPTPAWNDPRALPQPRIDHLSKKKQDFYICDSTWGEGNLSKFLSLSGPPLGSEDTPRSEGSCMMKSSLRCTLLRAWHLLDPLRLLFLELGRTHKWFFKNPEWDNLWKWSAVPKGGKDREEPKFLVGRWSGPTTLESCSPGSTKWAPLELSVSTPKCLQTQHNTGYTSQEIRGPL